MTISSPHVSEMRDRRLTDAEVELPFEHEHYGAWVQMQVVRAGEIERNGLIRRETTFGCPSCGYELTESILTAVSIEASKAG